MTSSLYVSNISCANCAKSIHLALEQQKLEDICIEISSGEVTFKNPKAIPFKSIKKSVENIGFKIATNPYKEGYKKLYLLFFICLVLTIPLNALMFLPDNSIFHQPLLQFSLALPVFIIGIFHFGKSAFYSIKAKVPNMDVLIFIGSTAAFIYSLFNWINYQEGILNLFFETSASIITLVLLGNLIEKKSLKNTNKTINELKKLQATKAQKINLENGVIETISPEKLTINDVIIVNQGDFISADGKIINGKASVNESMLTGESLPVDKAVDDDVFSGCYLATGAIQIRVTKTSDKNCLANIINLIKETQLNKPTIQMLGDKVSGIFVPIVLGLSLLTFILAMYAFNLSLYDAMIRAISVLVVSCPCAMGLATPTAIMVGIDKAAKKGILIKSGSVLEKFAKTKYIIFDKTGTLTDGSFAIKSITPYNNYSQEIIKQLIYNLEIHSSHPIAKSLVKEIQDENNAKLLTKITWKSISETPGVGINAKDKTDNTYVIEKSVESAFDIELKKNKETIATIAITDKLKPNTKHLVNQLSKENIDLILLSGDAKEKVKTIAKEIGFKTFFSEKTPKEKHEITKDYNKKGITTMIGDGINDSPSLAQADVAISFGQASQIAIENADIIMLNKQISEIETAYKISRQTLRTIKQNLFWALAYNLIAIPFVAFTGLSPIIATAAMAFSDVFVIGNSLRIKLKN